MELIERESFLSILQEGFENIITGEGHCFFIMGEPGIGKSALAKTFLQTVDDRCIQYTGACDSLFTPRPLAPLIDLALQLKVDWVDKIQVGLSRADLFSKFAETLTSKEEPIVLFFEDIHWADEATVDFIKFFSRRINQTKCMFILTFRDGEITDKHPLRNLLGEISPGNFTRLQLTHLSLPAVLKMAEEKGYDGENVYKISGGNPFYVTEILASYSPGIPANIKDSVLAVFNKEEGCAKKLWQLLSVLPEGLEVSRLNIIAPAWDASVEHCLNAKILIVKNNIIFFKHELYRRTIEESLSPFQRINLNKMILDNFLESFETNGEIEKLIHHAKNANENELVVKFAPIAALQAASTGAHMEALKLYLTAIQYSDGKETEELIKLYEKYSYECYLTNQIQEAIIFQRNALHAWQAAGKTLETGNNARFLSRLWWVEGNRKEAEKYAYRAIEILQDQPASKAKGMAFSNMSQVKMYSDEIVTCIEWGNKAIDMAIELGDEEIRCHALNNIGTVQWGTGSADDKGKQLLLESLSIALQNDFDEHAARAYSNIVFKCLSVKDYAQARKYLDESIVYCEERDLDSSKSIKYCLKAWILFETGEWAKAESIINDLFQNAEQMSTVKTGALTILAKIKIRRGDPDQLNYLQEAKKLSFITKEYQRIIPALIACMEYEWLTGNTIISDEELSTGISLLHKTKAGFQNGDLCFWIKKARNIIIDPLSPCEPYQLLNAGKIEEAAHFWETHDCHYEKAIALTEGDETDMKEGLSILHQLGATAVYEKIKSMMRAEGIKNIPRGIRNSTKNNPAQLTNRELDVLSLLPEGSANKEIASTLFISPKTVDHHISSLFFKLDVNTRAKAVVKARCLGILK